ncbi:unnamed protein product [Linum tenue]|uniref:DEK-C domain-containing protein n=2 Tax=Linum tenue TaxID=586396 RepID=A0AAV0RYI2_9ROSI|nr:unnamed protein product [Linum tenue]
MAAEKQGATQPAAKDPAEINDAPPDVESQIRTAMRSRVDYFKDQADSLTFEGVRRVLEKDLGLEKFALDVHKRFVKQWLLECMQGAVDGSGHQDSTEKVAKAACSIEEAVEIPGEDVSKLDTKDHDSEEEKMEDSPVMGLLTGHKKSKTETNKNKDIEKKVPSESIIKKTILKRASYIGANSESITMAGLRRLLEEDLKLDSCALDPFKKFISTQLDEVLQSPEIYTSKKKTVANKSQDRFAKGVSIDVRSDSSGKVEDEQDVDEANPKRKVGLKERSVSTEGPKKRKSSEKESKVSGNKQSKRPKTSSHDNSESADEVNASDNGDSQSSQEKPVKKREPSTPAPIYGKRVEHLKSVIKSCGMSVPPAIYKKVKQVPENKREAELIKELEAILSREDLSSNPSEKEIKEVRRRKERAKELEGIDMSNIVSSSRRRSTSSYVPPPKPPKVPIESDSDSDEAEDEDDDDNNEHEDVDNDVDEESESEELEDKGK